jgi:hypothetical protein
MTPYPCISRLVYHLGDETNVISNCSFLFLAVVCVLKDNRNREMSMFLIISIYTRPRLSQFLSMGAPPKRCHTSRWCNSRPGFVCVPYTRSAVRLMANQSGLIDNGPIEEWNCGGACACAVWRNKVIDLIIERLFNIGGTSWARYITKKALPAVVL